MKKLSIVSMFVCIFLLAACNQSGEATSNGKNQSITVVSREEGSGTRGAFIELFGIEEKDASGEKMDLTTDKAIVTNSTAVMLTTVSGDPNAVGYASLGALDDSVSVLPIDGVVASKDTIKEGKYKISRPFNLVTQETVRPLVQDFLDFILSEEGQKVIQKQGYIPVSESANYQASSDSGKIVVSGSSSITPVMEKLKEAYELINPTIAVEIQQSDSSTGVANTIEGTADIGMVSRELKESEKEKKLQVEVIAIDGIAVIVNKKNKVEGMTSEQVKTIFTGEETTWESFVSE